MENMLFFKTPQDFREWLAQNHNQQKELWVAYYKKATQKPSITWSESVDQALCYGWIDGIRKTVDEESYKVRFTPRRPNSVWSAVNLKKMKVLQEQGLMEAPGLAIYEKRNPENDEKEAKLPEAYQQLLEANPVAWKFFSQSAPFYQRQMIWWVIRAKKETTQIRRLNKLIEYSAAGKKIIG
ncbi:YdeI/OmpD-associated family protein [Microscilla marina]|uniref:Bacteriocin-protection protein n=1 Tax=Microscilla marina ATCC 23134 TaxID=313606 RepID=A1ZDI5_MICM2|nr:YdeI/OmpD-associated family protein [Microscilla marina]EAY31724.1 conserved hypothetical protein [Microscilla marina ATCC 23134]